MKALTGTGVAMVTPFTNEETLDLKGLQALTEHLISGGVDYLVILGTTGESATLDADEKRLVIETIIEANNGRVPYVLGAGGNDTASVCRTMGEWEEAYQPTAFLSVSPFYNKPSQEGIFQHFSMVAGCTDVPIILYNVPGRTASNMLPSTVIRLAEEWDNIVAIKEASGNVEQAMEIIRDKPAHFMVLSGDDILGISQLAAGFEGVISVAGNAQPKQFSDIVRASLAGDFVTARKLHYELLTLMQLHFAEGNPAGVKANLAIQGICGPQTRLPLVPATAELSAKIKKAISELG